MSKIKYYEGISKRRPRGDEQYNELVNTGIQSGKEPK